MDKRKKETAIQLAALSLTHTQYTSVIRRNGLSASAKNAYTITVTWKLSRTEEKCAPLDSRVPKGPAN
jgi:hypothetical protein